MAAQTSSRKQWSLSRGPKGNVESIVWTECGCPKQQVNLAKQLLEDNEEEGIDKEEKERLGVYWLTKASEKGYEEATQMLLECSKNRIGITEHNISDVKACLETSQEVKLSRQAAKELFSSLSQGENFITTYQLYKEMTNHSADNSNIDGGDLVSWNILEEGSGEKLTEDMFISSASHYSKGDLPSVLKKQLMIRSSRYSNLISGISNVSILPHPVMIILLLVLFGVDNFINTIPHFLYYGSLIAMVISSCQVITKRWDLANFQRWSNLLVSYGCSERISFAAQWTHCIKNSRPCFIFLTSLFVNLLVSSQVPEPPLSDISVLSFIMSLFCLYNTVYHKNKVDLLYLSSFVIHIFTRINYGEDTLISQFLKNRDINFPSSYILGGNIKFCLNLNVIFYLMLPSLFLGMAVRDRWMGIFKTLLPHLICLSWWHLAVIGLKGSSFIGLTRVTLGLVGIIVILPMPSITFLIIPLTATTSMFLNGFNTITLTLSCITLMILLYFTIKRAKPWTILYYLLVFTSFISLIIGIRYHTETIKIKNLEWKEYEYICNKNDIKNVEACLALSGTYVTWEGDLISAKISSVDNPILPLVNRLSENLVEMVKCLFGEKIYGCDNGNNCTNSHSYWRCHLSNWNRFEYEFQVELGTNDWAEKRARGWLLGGDSFRNQSLTLKPGDRVLFSGYLMSYLHNLKNPHVRIESLICLSCSEYKVPVPKTMFNVPAFLKPYFNFVFYPFALFIN